MYYKKATKIWKFVPFYLVQNKLGDFFSKFVALSKFRIYEQKNDFFKIFRSTQNIWTLPYGNLKPLKSYELYYGFFPLSTISLPLDLWISLWKTVWLHNGSNRQMSDNFLPWAERSIFKPAKAIKEDTNQHATFFRDTPQTLGRGKFPLL